MVVVKQAEQTETWSGIVQKVESQLSELKSIATQVSTHSNDLLRLKKAHNFLLLLGRLDMNSADAPDTDILRQSIIVHDIDVLLKDGHLDDIPVFQEELNTFKAFKTKITTNGLEWLEQGLEQGNQTLLSKGIQIFVNLHTLSRVVCDLMEKYQKEMADLCKYTFDLSSLNAEMTELKKSGNLGSRSIPLVAFAGILWSRTEKLADSIYTHTSKINSLEVFLSRKNDSASRVFLLQYVKSEMKGLMNEDEGLKSYFWRILCENLDIQLKAATKSANFLLQVLQAGYPKLLRIFSDLFGRIKLSTGQEEFGHVLINTTLKPFETAYISRSLTRLLETVSQIVHKGTPNREDAQKLARTISSELNAVKFNSDLLDLVCQNVVRALGNFRQKIDLMVAHDTVFSITSSTPSTVQLQKIDIINCLYSLSESIWALLQDYDGSVIEGSIVDATESLTLLMTSIATPIFKNIISDLVAVMSKMHKDQDATPRTSRTNLTGSIEASTSPYMTDYISKIRWVFREVFAKLHLESTGVDWAKTFAERIIYFHLLHSSITPITADSRIRISNDLGYLESSLSQSLSLCNTSFDALSTSTSLKSFKKLIYLELGDIASSIPVSSLLACNHVLKKSVIPSPVDLYKWTELDYVNWMDTVTEAQVKTLITKCLDVYLGNLEETGIKETCLEHPTLRKLLLDWTPIAE